MNLQEIIDFVNQRESPKIKYAFTDIDGVLRGKIIHRQKFLDGLTDGFGFCDVVCGWDSSDAPYDNGRVTGWHSGYPDAPVRIDMSTFRQLPWEDNIPFFLADFSGGSAEQDSRCAGGLPPKFIEAGGGAVPANGFSCGICAGI